MLGIVTGAAAIMQVKPVQSCVHACMLSDYLSSSARRNGPPTMRQALCLLQLEQQSASRGRLSGFSTACVACLQVLDLDVLVSLKVLAELGVKRRHLGGLAGVALVVVDVGVKEVHALVHRRLLVRGQVRVQRLPGRHRASAAAFLQDPLAISPETAGRELRGRREGGGSGGGLWEWGSKLAERRGAPGPRASSDALGMPTWARARHVHPARPARAPSAPGAAPPTAGPGWGIRLVGDRSVVGSFLGPARGCPGSTCLS